jgi:hypothetical protein
MDVGVFSGRVAMDDLNVSNPTGFKSAHFLQMGKGRVGVSLGTLMEDKVVLPELTLSGLNVNLEHHEGKANYKVIIDNLKKFESGEKPAEEKEEKESKQFVIEKVTISDVHVEVELLPIGGDLTRVPVTIERIELKNVGSGGDGIALAELTAIVLKAILKTVVDRAGDMLPGDIAGELTAGLDQLKGLGEVSVQVVGQVTTEVAEKVAEAAEEIGKAAEEGAEELGKAVDEGTKKVGAELDKAGKEVGKGLEGLLGGKDKKDE